MTTNFGSEIADFGLKQGDYFRYGKIQNFKIVLESLIQNLQSTISKLILSDREKSPHPCILKSLIG